MQLPKILRLIRRNRRCGDRGCARYSRHHRQSGFHPSRGAARARPRCLDSDRRLRLAVGLGVAAGPGARDAQLCRSRAGAAAVRAGGISQAARAALQLCRPSPDRADRLAAARTPRSGSGATQRRRFCWCCRAAAAARSGIIWRCSARRSAGCRRRARPSSRCCRPCRISRGGAEGVKSWPVQPRIVIGETEKRAAFRIAHAALAKSGTVTLELALSGVPMVAAYRVGGGGGLDPAARDQGAVGDPGQSRDRRERRCRNSSSRIARRKSSRARCADAVGQPDAPAASSRRSRKLDAIMSTGHQPPSVRAADIVLATMRKARAERCQLGAAMRRTMARNCASELEIRVALCASGMTAPWMVCSRHENGADRMTAPFQRY